MKMRRRSDGSIGLAYLYQGPFNPLPDWLDVYEKAGKLRKASETKPMEVRVITGRWWVVNVNDWIIGHGDDLWLIGDEDVGHTHDEA